MFSDVKRHLIGAFVFLIFSDVGSPSPELAIFLWPKEREASVFGWFQGLVCFGTWSWRLVINPDRFAAAVRAEWLYL